MDTSSEWIYVMKCKEIFSGEFTEKKKELLSLLKASGYNVPNVFAPD